MVQNSPSSHVSPSGPLTTSQVSVFRLHCEILHWPASMVEQSMPQGSGSPPSPPAPPMPPPPPVELLELLELAPASSVSKVVSAGQPATAAIIHTAAAAANQRKPEVLSILRSDSGQPYARAQGHHFISGGCRVSRKPAPPWCVYARLMNDEAVVASVVGLHAFFVDWFSGKCPQDQAIFDERFVGRMDPLFELVPPSGVVTGMERLSQILWASHGSNPDFRIAIRNVRQLKWNDDWLLVRYEEWQRNAVNSTPANNGRIATALLQQASGAPQGLSWLTVHETWLPETVMSAGPYDF